MTESWKFRNKAFVRFATPRQVHTLVTDSGLSAADRADLEGNGTNILVVENEEYETG